MTTTSCHACGNPIDDMIVWLPVKDTGTTAGTGWRPFCITCAYLEGKANP